MVLRLKTRESRSPPGLPRTDLRCHSRRAARSAAREGNPALTQPRLNDLLRGRIGKFSLDALMVLAGRAGLTVRLEILRPAA